MAVTTNQQSNIRCIICIKWGDKYGTEHVIRLYCMMAQHFAQLIARIRLR